MMPSATGSVRSESIRSTRVSTCGLEYGGCPSAAATSSLLPALVAIHHSSSSSTRAVLSYCIVISVGKSTIMPGWLGSSVGKALTAPAIVTGRREPAISSETVSPTFDSVALRNVVFTIAVIAGAGRCPLGCRAKVSGKSPLPRVAPELNFTEKPPEVVWLDGAIDGGCDSPIWLVDQLKFDQSSVNGVHALPSSCVFACTSCSANV